MRLLYVTHQYPPAIGGSEKYVGDLSQDMASRGHQVDVYTSRSRDYRTWRSELAPRECLNGVSVYRFRSLRRTWLAWRALEWGLSGYWRTGARRFEALALLGSGPICPGMFAALLARVRQYDLVHLNGLVYSHSAYAYWVARRRGVPVVVTPIVEIAHRVTYDLGYQSRILQGCDHVLALTEGERAFLIERGVSPLRVTTGGCGVRITGSERCERTECRRRLGLPSEAFVALFLGRQVRYKGIEMTLDAFALLRRRYPDLLLVVAGPETDESRCLFARWRDAPGLLNLGRVSDEQRLDLLNACDCLVLPSTGESFGIVYLEAWSVGKPVIGIQTRAIATVIEEGEDGWLVPPGDPVALAEALARWIDAPHLARQMGERGRTKVLDRYTTARVADVAEGVYLRTLRARHTQSVGGRNQLTEQKS
jgi:glycosyltransferase involved in cell wall biosynthesis